MFDTCFFFFSCFCSGIHHLARVGSTFHRLFALDHIFFIIIHSANRHLLTQKKYASGLHFLKKTHKRDVYQNICKKKTERKHQEKAILFLRCLQILMSNRKSNAIDLDILIQKDRLFLSDDYINYS